MISTVATGFLGVAVQACALCLLLSLLFAAARLLRGPTLPDRVIALDLIAILLVAFLALVTMATGKDAYLDVAVALALVAFLGTVAFARFIDRNPNRGETKATSIDPVNGPGTGSAGPAREGGR